MSRRVWIARLALALSSALSVLLLAEGALRLVRPPFLAFDHLPAVFVPDPELGYRYAAGRESHIERHEFRVPIRINAAGFFDDEFRRQREPGVARIAAVGDSFTAGFHVGRGLNFPDLLEARLDAGGGGRRFEVMNFGMIGTGTVEQAALFRREVLAYEPDLVLLVFFANDVDDVRRGLVLREAYKDHVLIYVDPAQRPALAAEVDAFLEATPGLLRTAVEQSLVLRAAYAAWTAGARRLGEPTLLSNRVRARDLGSQDRTRAEAVALVVERVLELHAACAAEGRGFLFVVLPTRQEVDGRAQLAALPILERLEQRGVRTLSLLAAFRERHRSGERLYWERDDHCNEAGYALVAEELHRHLLD